MALRPDTLRAWTFLLLAGIALPVSLARAESRPLPRLPHSQLTPELRSQVTEASNDSTPMPWQREFMKEVMRGQSPQFQLTAEFRSWVAEAAMNPLLRPWQLEFMREVMRGQSEVFGAGASAAPPPDGAAAEDGHWIGILPDPRAYHAAIYDPVRDRMITFGGAFGSEVGCARAAASWSRGSPGSVGWASQPGAEIGMDSTLGFTDYR